MSLNRPQVVTVYFKTAKEQSSLDFVHNFRKQGDQTFSVLSPNSINFKRKACTWYNMYFIAFKSI